MSPKRLDRVPPPPIQAEWEVKFGTTEAAKDWAGLCDHAKQKTREAFELMRSNPRPPQDGDHYQLRGELATRSLRGRTLEQWQIKVSGSGRIWYLPDDGEHTVWVGGLPLDEYIKTFVDHAPDLTPEQVERLRVIFSGATEG